MRSGFVFFFALALAACAPQAQQAPSTPASYLAGTSWRRVDDANANPHGATIEFSADRASGHTGCNRWFASVTHSGEALRFGPIGMTRMACQAEVQAAAERGFVAALEATRFAHYDRDALVLLDEDQQVIARFDSAR